MSLVAIILAAKDIIFSNMASLQHLVSLSEFVILVQIFLGFQYEIVRVTFIIIVIHFAIEYSCGIEQLFQAFIV